LPRNQTFPKSEHLRYGHQFRLVYDQGRKIVGRMMVLYALVPDPADTESVVATGRTVGFVTSRRVGGAVGRNRARRLMRESYRRQRHRLPSRVAMVLVARPAIEGRKQPEVETELLELWQRAGLRA
jgi:ribonuclease P protein component